MGWFKRSKETKMKQNFFRQNASMLLQEKMIRGGRSLNVAKVFTLSELQQATKNFDSSMIIGQGGRATVYKGFLAYRKAIAIKTSKEYDAESIYQFRNELLMLSSFHHQNVVKLIGCCLETQVPLIVFEYIANGTLSELLQSHINGKSLDWNLHLKIATETANMLSYLHSVPSSPILHRDVKSANIMIDHDFTAKVIGFGSSKVVIPVDPDEILADEVYGMLDEVRGTLGYLDPEFYFTGKLTEKSDVYSFGVVLVELLTCMKAVSVHRLQEDRSLALLFLRRLDEGRLFEIVDNAIVSDGNREQLTEYSMLAQACLNVRGQDRPSMKEVAIVLEGLRFGGEKMKVAATILQGLRFDEKLSSDDNVEDDIEETEYLDDSLVISV